MRAVFEEEEEELARADYRPDRTHDREVIIGATTLLAIFFGLVLLCGLFFGLGYTLGRRTPFEGSSSLTGRDPGSPQAAAPGSSNTSGSSSGGAKPSAAAQSGQSGSTSTQTSFHSSDVAAQPDPSNQAEISADAGLSATQSNNSTQSNSASVLVPAAIKTSVKAAETGDSAQAKPAGPAQQGSGSGTMMVQIAAVSNPADADVLVSALRKRGYSITVRHEPGDSLMHVQVGPFATKTEASAMRQKLLDDGYNAILK